MKILDGKMVAAEMRQSLAKEIKMVTDTGIRAPKLAIITVGEDPASQVYIRNKMRACEEVGIEVVHNTFDASCSITNIKVAIWCHNYDPTIDGIMVQLPLPPQFDERIIIDCIDPKKDVDGLTTTNIGRLRSGQPGFRPCTAKGIIDLCHYYQIALDGKDVVILGRSNIVGKPLADMMMAEGATVSQCHSHTKDISFYTVGADIVISAIGKPKYLCREHFFPGQLDAIIDVGINHDEEGKLCGDVNFDAVQAYTDAITPVPGGVGPMTVVELLSNTVDSWKENIAKLA